MLASAGLCAGAAATIRCSRGSGSKPTIVFVVLDTVRADHTSLCGYGRPTTPTLQRLAQQGASYTCDAYAPGDWTLPSHASFFTGVDVVEHGAHFTAIGSKDGVPLFDQDNLVNPLRPDLPTLAEKLRKEGYFTVSISANPIVTEEMGLTRGFEVARAAKRFGHLYRDQLASQVDDVLREHVTKRGQPLFLFVNISDAHPPWDNIPADISWLKPREGIASYFMGETQSIWAKFVTGRYDDSEKREVLARVNDLYDFGLWQTDRSVEALLKVLEDRGRDMSSLRLVVTSDHGEYLGEHGLLDHGHYLYEANNRVPLLYWEKGRKVSFPRPVSGLNAYNLVLGDDTRLLSTPILAFGYPGQWWLRVSGGHVGGSSFVALWTADRKLVWKDGKVARYNVQRDPQEAEPQAADGDERLAWLEEQVQRFKASTGVTTVSPEAMEKLRSAGYIH